MRTIYTEKQITNLKKNPCVFDCTEKTIHYTSEFKKRALDLYMQGIKAKEIWKQAGFDVRIWKRDYFTLTLKDWRRIVKKCGVEGLSRLGGLMYDRGTSNNREEIKINANELKRLELEIKYLKAENAFLAKLRAKRAELNSRPAKNTTSSGN